MLKKLFFRALPFLDKLWLTLPPPKTNCLAYKEHFHIAWDNDPTMGAKSLVEPVFKFPLPHFL